MKSPQDLASGKNPFVVTKSSNIPGKAGAETPGLVCGNMDQEIKKIAVLMTLTESGIELAGATGVGALVAHHPIVDATNTGGVLLKTYLGLYNIAALSFMKPSMVCIPVLPIFTGTRRIMLTLNTEEFRETSCMSARLYRKSKP